MHPARVRFAPSPTGSFHIGGARTALYNYLLARQTGGQFILRIEDTDVKRSTDEALQELLTALRWLGLEWDEGPDVGGPHAPYTQLARKHIYLEHAQQLLETGHAYRCFCSAERLKQIRLDQQQRRESPRYDGTCREIGRAESGRRAASGEPFTIRFKTPRTGGTTAVDRLRGPIRVDNSTIDDFILVKSDGYALYHLAAMVDDHLMGITHVLRGQEWLGTFPLHALILRAFGWQEPEWCHLSVFLKPAGKGKMSKRDVTSEQSIFVLGLRDLGYLPEAINNWVALMGASFGAEERPLSLEEMTAQFSLDRLTPSPARVSFDKLDHYNGLYMRQLDAADLAARLRPYLEQAGLAPSEAVLLRVAPLVQQRLVTLDDVVPMAGFFFRETVEPALEDLVGKKMTAAESARGVRQALAVLAGLAGDAGIGPETAEAPLRALAEALGVGTGQLFGILRAAVTGQSVSPPLFESMAVIGREKVLARLEAAAARLEQMG